MNYTINEAKSDIKLFKACYLVRSSGGIGTQNAGASIYAKNLDDCGM